MWFLIVFVLLLLAELGYFRLADRLNIIDKPNERSSHSKSTLRGGKRTVSLTGARLSSQ